MNENYYSRTLRVTDAISPVPDLWLAGGPQTCLSYRASEAARKTAVFYESPTRERKGSGRWNVNGEMEKRGKKRVQGDRRRNSRNPIVYSFYTSGRETVLS